MNHTSHTRAVRFGWQQQYLPFLNNRPLADMDFVDSLAGFGVTGDGTGGDTNYIIKTADGGKNWFVIYTIFRDLNTVSFLDANTGFVLGAGNFIGGYLTKTTNGGLTWIDIPTQFGGAFNDIHVLNEDTIWISDNMGLIGGLWRTTDGGVS
jgi:photosystem II stability/assembly factor-like uncharacterized protein